MKILLYLGDYIDRGSQPSQVIDCLLEDQFSDFQKIFLLGNHEQVLLQFLNGSDPSIALDWFSFGGLATLVSYGVQLHGIPIGKDLAGLRADFANKLPVSHLEFYQRLLINYEIGDYFFVHAGVKPKVKLQKQRPEDMLWIRDEFLDSHLFHGKMIVHGHHVTDEPVKLPNRIGLDTGAYSSGRLTCAVFEDTSCHFL